MYELWSHVGYDCILMGNYNSAHTILESLVSTPIARLQNKVSKFIFRYNIFGLTTIFCLKRRTSSSFHEVKKLTENFPYLWKQQTSKSLYKSKNSIKEAQQLNWVEIPIFAKIVESALNERTYCLKK